MEALPETDPALIPLLERYAQLRPVDPLPHKRLARIHLAGATPELAIPHLDALVFRSPLMRPD